MNAQADSTPQTWPVATLRALAQAFALGYPFAFWMGDGRR